MQNKLLKELVEDEVLEWYKMSSQKRFIESQKLWETFILLGGSYDSLPDSQSPFDEQYRIPLKSKSAEWRKKRV